MLYFTWKLELVSNILWMVIAISCDKIGSKWKWLNKLNSIAMLSEIIISWWLFWLYRPIINNDSSKREGSIKELEQMKHLSVRKYKKWLHWDYCEKWKAIYQTTAKYTRDPRSIFSLMWCSSWIKYLDLDDPNKWYKWYTNDCKHFFDVNLI